MPTPVSEAARHVAEHASSVAKLVDGRCEALALGVDVLAQLLLGARHQLLIAAVVSLAS